MLIDFETGKGKGNVPDMKSSLSRALASLAVAFTLSASAAVPDLTVRLDLQRHDIVKVSAAVPTNSTWILEGANNPNGTWSQLVTLKPSGYQMPVSNAPSFLRLRRGNEVGDAVSVYRTELTVRLIGHTVKVVPLCPLPPGRWILQQTPDLKQWTDRATFENSGYQIDAANTPVQHLSYRLVLATR